MECYPPGLKLRKSRTKGESVEYTFKTNQKPKKNITFGTTNEYFDEFRSRGFTHTRYIAKGSTEQAKTETEFFNGGSFGNSRRHRNAIELALRYVDKLLSKRSMHVRQYISSKDVREANVKNFTSSPGEPWCFLGGTYRDLLAKLDSKARSSPEFGGEVTVSTPTNEYKLRLTDGADILFAIYLVFRDSVLAGGIVVDDDFVEGLFPILTFLVHSKEDKYSTKKILEEAYRTIQGTDVLTMMLMQEFCGSFKDCLYDDKDHWLVTLTPFELMQTRERMRHKYTTGIDYTSFDRFQSPQLTFALFDHLVTHGLDKRVADFVSATISYGWLAFHGEGGLGELIPRLGGNPSGQYWTTLTNCFSHTVYIAYLYADVDEDELDEAYTRFTTKLWYVHGDDEIVAHDSAEEAEEYINNTLAVREQVQQITKPEMLATHESETCVFPPGLLAPFLGTTCQFCKEGVNIVVPCQPTRRLPHLFFKDLSEDTFPATVRGVTDSLYSLRFLSQIRGEPLHPLSEFLEYVCSRTKSPLGTVSAEVLTPLGFVTIYCTDDNLPDSERRDIARDMLASGVFKH